MLIKFCKIHLPILCLTVLIATSLYGLQVYHPTSVVNHCFEFSSSKICTVWWQHMY